MLFMARAKEKNITLDTDIDINIPECLKFDPVRMQQVLSNLIGNAIKFTPEDGEVALYAKLIDKKENRAKIKIGVKDTGIGISEEAKKKIFDAFSQADTSTTRKFGGTGLGLAISSHLVSLMGGKLQVDSEVGKGSDFFFEVEFEICKPKYSIKEIFKSLNVILVKDNNKDNNEEDVKKIVKYFEIIGVNYKIIYSKEAIKYLTNNNIFVLFCPYNRFLLNELMKKDISTIIICDNDNMVEVTGDVNIRVLKDIDNFSTLYNDLLEIGLLQHYIENDDNNFDKSYKGKVLIAEDNEVNQLLIKELLAQYKLNPIIVNNGKEAVKEALKDKYDLIFMDVSMPEMNGVEAMKILKQKIKTPIIALTANAMEGDKEKFLKEGFDDYLSKPIIIEELEKILEKYLKIKKSKNTQKENKYVDFNFIKNELPLDDKLLFKIFETFLNSYPKILEELEEAIEHKDFERIYRLGHKLKGAAANIRLKSVAKIAEEMEKSAKEKKDIDYENLFNQLQTVLENVKKELEEIMKK
jgi:CheY-like chemotaxis protein